MLNSRLDVMQKQKNSRGEGTLLFYYLYHKSAVMDMGSL